MQIQHRRAIICFNHISAIIFMLAVKRKREREDEIQKKKRKREANTVDLSYFLFEKI